MKTAFASVLLAGLFLSVGAIAAPPADAPAGTTGLCKDGSYYSGATKKGACRGHKGIKEWYAEDSGKAEKADKADKTEKAAKADKTEKAAKPAAAAEPAAPSKEPAKAAAAAAPAKEKTMPKPAAEAAAGGGNGKVWVNESTKIYHCEGDRWYGKTKEGSYMSIADATAKGYKPSRGKECGK